MNNASKGRSCTYVTRLLSTFHAQDSSLVPLLLLWFSRVTDSSSKHNFNANPDSTIDHGKRPPALPSCRQHISENLFWATSDENRKSRSIDDRKQVAFLKNPSAGTPSLFRPRSMRPKTSRNEYCMETIGLTEGFDLKRISQSWENLSAEHSIDLGSTPLFGDRFGIQLSTDSQ
jgi:hypothetical protein